MRKKIAIETLLTLFISTVALLAMIYIQGPVHSISAYVTHDNTNVLFKLFMLTIIIGTYRSNKIEMCVCALGVAVFDISATNVLINVLHNISAILFMIWLVTTTYHKKPLLTACVALSLVLYPIFGLYVGELTTIAIMYTYYTHKSFKLLRP